MLMTFNRDELCDMCEKILKRVDQKRAKRSAPPNTSWFKSFLIGKPRFSTFGGITVMTAKRILNTIRGCKLEQFQISQEEFYDITHIVSFSDDW